MWLARRASTRPMRFPPRSSLWFSLLLDGPLPADGDEETHARVPCISLSAGQHHCSPPRVGAPDSGVGIRADIRCIARGVRPASAAPAPDAVPPPAPASL